jgi:hypothetical protein
MSVERFPIEASHVLMFARSIGDPNPVYSDAEYAKRSEVGAIIAPPTFVQASAQFDPDYSLRPKPGQPWFGSGKNATGLPDRVVEVVEAAVAARPAALVPPPAQVGDVLGWAKPGKSWEKEGHCGRLGRRVSHRCRDQNGDLVVTATGVGVFHRAPATEVEMALKHTSSRRARISPLSSYRT